MLVESDSAETSRANFWAELSGGSGMGDPLATAGGTDKPLEPAASFGLLLISARNAGETAVPSLGGTLANRSSVGVEENSIRGWLDGITGRSGEMKPTSGAGPWKPSLAA